MERSEGLDALGAKDYREGFGPVATLDTNNNLLHAQRSTNKGGHPINCRKDLRYPGKQRLQDPLTSSGGSRIECDASKATSATAGSSGGFIAVQKSSGKPFGTNPPFAKSSSLVDPFIAPTS